MPDFKRLGIVGGTLVAIIGIGFFMQRGATPPAQGEVTVQAMGAAVEISSIVETSAQLAAPAFVVTEAVSDIALNGPVLPSDAVVTPVALKDAPIATTDREAPVAALSCDIDMTATPQSAAMVKLSLSAPCLPNERVTMHHNGMMFSDVTDSDGSLVLTVPALGKAAVYIASFANGEGAVASTHVSALAFYDRTVVQSDSKSAVSLHALEFGADYGGVGHVSAGSASTIEAATRGEGGFLVTLGSPELENPLVAQVYSFPAGTANRDGEIEMSVEIEVTAQNCGRDIEAQSLQVEQGAAPKVQNLDMSMPDCDAIGDFLVLKNLVNDLKVARK